MNSKGQTLNIISATVIGFMVLIFIIFAVLFGISALDPSSFFDANSAESNATAALSGGVAEGVESFGSRIPVVFTVLGIVLVLAGIVLLVLYVRRMQGASGGGGGGL